MSEIIAQQPALTKYFADAKVKKKKPDMALNSSEYDLIRRLAKVLRIFEDETKKVTILAVLT